MKVLLTPNFTVSTQLILGLRKIIEKWEEWTFKVPPKGNFRNVRVSRKAFG